MMKKPKILIVEDEGITGSYIESTLEELGYNVVSIEFSAEEAIKRAEEASPDLVLMDIKLQGHMDGVEAAGYIRTNFNIPVIYLTAHSNKEILERAKLTESFGYIIKPFEKRELQSNIEMALYKHRMEEKARRAYNIQQIISSVLKVSLESVQLDQLLEKILDLLISISWLSFQSKGCIFLFEKELNTLVMKAHRNLEEGQLKVCSKVPLGVCHCGNAALTEKIVFSDSVNHKHEIKYKEMDSHGHYCVPVLSNCQLLGVINMYVREGHKRDEEEESFLLTIANTLAGIIERKRIEQNLEEFANYDMLTGLPNRKLFFDRLSHDLSIARRDYHNLGLLFIDLNKFKFINDNLGHNYGDIALKELATRLRKCIRSSDTAARFGGDEFIVILTKIEREQDAAFIAQKIITSLCAPLILRDSEYTIGVSIGISIFPAEADNATTLIKNADTAMYQAKECSGSNYNFYSIEMDELMTERLTFENEMRLAVERRAFHLHYQPIIGMKTLQITGVEALLRWHHHTYGMVEVSDMIPVAESTGMIISIGEWALREAIKQIIALHEQGFSSLRICVNLSICQFLRQNNFFEMIAQILFESGLKPEYLDLEITENICMENVSETVGTLKELNAMGTLLSIDDFGAGLSSLSLLKHLPVQRLKIDGTFIRKITDNAVDAAVAGAITSIGHSMGLKVVAERVETKEQFQFIQALKCDEAQGYFFCHPIPSELLTKKLSQLKEFLNSIL